MDKTQAQHPAGELDPILHHLNQCPSFNFKNVDLDFNDLSQKTAKLIQEYQNSRLLNDPFDIEHLKKSTLYKSLDHKNLEASPLELLTQLILHFKKHLEINHQDSLDSPLNTIQDLSDILLQNKIEDKRTP